MATFRVKREPIEKRYTPISNAMVLDDSISDETLRLILVYEALTYMQSSQELPIEKLIEYLGWDENKIFFAIKEAQENGYLKSE